MYRITFVVTMQSTSTYKQIKNCFSEFQKVTIVLISFLTQVTNLQFKVITLFKSYAMSLITKKSAHREKSKYEACQSVCTSAVVQCYKSAGYIYGEEKRGPGIPNSLLICNDKLSKCMRECAEKSRSHYGQ